MIFRQLLFFFFFQESINLITFPELLTILLNVEALEDNEVLTIENARHISRINDPKNRALLEKLDTARKVFSLFYSKINKYFSNLFSRRLQSVA